MTNVDCVQAVMPCNMWQEMTQQRQPHRPDISSSGIAVLSHLILPVTLAVTRVCTQRDSQDAYDTCFVLSRTFCPARVTANTWQSYGKSVVVAYVVPRVCTTCIRSATCLYSTKITAKTWLYQQEQTYPQSGLPRLHKATVRRSRRKSTPARRPGLVLIRFVPCLHPPCALVGLDGRPPSSRDFAWPRCFAHAWPFQRRWVYAGYR